MLRSLPAAVKGPVQLDESQELIELRHDELIFGGETFLLFLQDFEFRAGEQGCGVRLRVHWPAAFG